uniref:hypothetical protein n=1 Tax=Escherichia coli TaxID=562 RepID=UPI002264FEC3|nr:hypothetical protein [Escherichia coli]
MLTVNTHGFTTGDDFHNGIVFVRTGREAGVLIIAELFSEVVTVSQPVPGEQETDITDGIRLSDWYYKYKKSSESNVKDLPE